jgi:hypothetical protein
VQIFPMRIGRGASVMRHARDVHAVQADDSLPRREPGREGVDRCPNASGQRVPDGAAAGSGYARIFGRASPEEQPGLEAIMALAAAMKARPYVSRDSGIPAGYTYLGQFIFHDITAMMPGPTPSEPRNARSPALDLDSVLPGLKPADTPELSDGEGLFKIGVTTEFPRPEDIPRAWRRPLLSDIRNDDFLPLSQCHLLMLKFYNAVARYLGHDGRERGDAWWREVRRTWRQHFQAIVLFDYLPRIVDAKTWRDVMENGRRLVRTGEGACDAWLPIEFAAAAGRFGHSMVRDFYKPWNARLAWSVVTVADFVEFSHANSSDGLEGGVPFLWSSNWLALFDFSKTRHAGTTPIEAARIDTHIAPALRELPSRLRTHMSDAARQGNSFDLAASTLNRGRELSLASAWQALQVANDVLLKAIPRLSLEEAFPRDGGLEKVAADFAALRSAPPLWYYVLREAELLASGLKLGPLGGRIVMETLHAAVEASDDSILGRSWSPTVPASKNSNSYSITDLILFSAHPDPVNSV